MLTSVVFGVLKHLPHDLGIGAFFRQCSGSPSLAEAVGAVAHVTVEFWPWWDEEDAPAGAEPDVALWVEGADAGRSLLVVEAKRGSGKSGVEERDQLARQISNGRALARRKQVRFLGLVYLTAHLRRPAQDMDSSLAALKKHFGQPPAPLWWASWRDMPRLLDAAEDALAHDPLRRTLCREAAACLRRWGLQRYQGITTTGWEVPEPYRFKLRYRWPQGAMPSAWTFKEAKK